MHNKTTKILGLILALTAGSALRAGVSTSSTKTTDHLFHGDRINTALLERQDAWWQRAAAEATGPKYHLTLAEEARFTPIFRGNANRKELALTFDDGPHPNTVPALLELLDRLHVKATFFVVGKMAEKHPELVRMEEREGHEIANHSFSHVNLSKLTEAEVRTEYRACNDLLSAILGHQPAFCRPPGGQVSVATTRAAAELGLKTAMWSDDPRDYSNPGETVIEDRTVDRVSNGGIILLHEGVQQTMDILPDLVARLQKKGFRFVTMSQLVSDSRTKSADHHFVVR